MRGDLNIMARTPSLTPAPAAYPLPQIPQLQAFSKGAQQTEAALNLANVLAQAYAMSKGRSRRQGRREALLQAIKASQEPSGWKNPDFNWVPPEGAVDMSAVGPGGYLPAEEAALGMRQKVSGDVIPESQRGAPDYRSRDDLSRQLKPFRPDTAVLPDDTQL